MHRVDTWAVPGSPRGHAVSGGKAGLRKAGLRKAGLRKAGLRKAGLRKACRWPERTVSFAQC